MKTLIKHQTRREELIRFLLLVAVLACYFGYLSWEYDAATGGIVAALTWSFFVLCTPIADAGFLLDFPVRLITGIRMLITEIAVWVLAIAISVLVLVFNPDAYATTVLTSLFYTILTTPFPYWSLILLCGIGTFLSIHFGDEMMDAVAHKDCHFRHRHGFKHRLIVMGALLLLVIAADYYLVESLGITIPSVAG